MSNTRIIIMRLTALVLSMVILFRIANSGFSEEPGSKPALWTITKSNTAEGTTFGNFWSSARLNFPKFQAVDTVKSKTGQLYRSTKATTFRWWRGTVDFLTPWNSPDRSSASGAGGAWLFRKREAPQVQTMSDFMRLDRPKF